MMTRIRNANSLKISFRRCMHIYLSPCTNEQFLSSENKSKISHNIETWSKRVFNYIGLCGSSNSKTHWKYMGTWQQWFWLISMVAKSSGSPHLSLFLVPPIHDKLSFYRFPGVRVYLVSAGGYVWPSGGLSGQSHHLHEWRRARSTLPGPDGKFHGDIRYMHLNWLPAPKTKKSTVKVKEEMCKAHISLLLSLRMI